MSNQAKVLVTAEDRSKDAFASLRNHVRDARASVDQFVGSIGGVRAALGGLAGAVGAGAALNQLTAAIDRMDAVDDLSAKLALSTTTLQELEFAGKLTGVSIDSMATGLKKLQVNMQEAAQGGDEQAALFKALGVSVTDASGNLRNAEEVMADVAAVFAGLEDGATKTALAVKLFGKSGPDLIPFLNEGREGLQNLNDEAHRLGVVINDEAIKAAAAFNDNLDRLRVLTQASASSIASDLVPAFNDLISRFLNAKKEGMGFWAALGAAGEMTIKRAAGMSYTEQIAQVSSEIEFVRTSKNPWVKRNSKERLAALEQEKRAIQAQQASLALADSEGNGDRFDRMLNPQSTVNAAAITRALGGNNSAADKAARERAKAEKEAYDAVMKTAQARSDLRNAEYDGIEKYLAAQEAERVATVRGANEAVEAAQREYDTFGLAQSQIELMTIARLEDRAAALEAGSAARKALEQEIESRKQLADLFRKGEDRDAAVKEQERIAAEAQKVWDNFGENVQRNLGDGLYNAMQGNFRGIGDAFKQMLMRMTADAAAANLSQLLLGAKGSSTGGLLGTVIKAGINIFSGGNTSASYLADADAAAGLIPIQSAKGNVFGSGRLIPFANGGAFTNGIVSEPTMFPIGLMGEAGEEAIMPLARGADGSLGVRASGGRQVMVHQEFNIHIDGSTDMERNKAMMQEVAARASAQANAQLVERLNREGTI